MRSPHHNDKQGVALIMAVGFLAVLILMAIGFAISMRVERLAARNFTDVIATRQHARTALTRALADLNGRLASDPLLLNSAQPGLFWQTGTPSTSGTNLLMGWASNYIPPHLASRVAQIDVPWIDIKDKFNETIGRYQYVVVDCSGLIDVNFDYGTNIYNGSSRTVLTNALDMKMDAAAFSEVLDFVKLKNGRNYAGALSPAPSYPWYRMESFAEVWRYLGKEQYGLGIFDRPPTNFFVYSRYPSTHYDRISNQIVRAQSIGFSQVEWDAIKTSLTSVTNPMYAIRHKLNLAFLEAIAASPSTYTGVGSLEYADNLARSLVDFCDSDSIPLAVTNSCTEATPLLNEITVEGRLTKVGEDYTLTLYPRVEVLYPFVGRPPNNKSYHMLVSMSISNASPSGFNGQYTAVQYTFLPPGGGWTWQPPYGQFVVSPPLGGAGAPVAPFKTVNIPTPGLPGVASMKCSVQVALFEGTAATAATLVDGAGVPTRMSVDLGGIVVDGPAYTNGLACNDPRHNGYTQQWWRVGQGGVAAVTLGQFNQNICTWNQPPYGETNAWIYIPDRALRTPGEIGLLGLGPKFAWHTVDLLDTPGGFNPYVLPVFDFFTTTNAPRRHGLININSLNRNVLAAAFNEVAREPYPGAVANGHAGAAAVSQTDADDLATRMLAQRTALASSNVAYASDVRLLGRAGAFGGAWKPGEPEAAVANAGNILGARDSVYTVIVNAQALSEETAEPISEQRALAVVWRDRVPKVDAAGQVYHPTFVRFFRWLTE